MNQNWMDNGPLLSASGIAGPAAAFNFNFYFDVMTICIAKFIGACGLPLIEYLAWLHFILMVVARSYNHWYIEGN